MLYGGGDIKLPSGLEKSKMKLAQPKFAISLLKVQNCSILVEKKASGTLVSKHTHQTNSLLKVVQDSTPQKKSADCVLFVLFILFELFFLFFLFVLFVIFFLFVLFFLVDLFCPICPICLLLLHGLVPAD